MSKEKREAFLADVHVGVVAVAGADGAPPLAAPVWYRYEPGGDVIINTGGESVKAKLLEAAGVASFCVQSEALPPAFVTVEGPVAVGPSDYDERLAIATRYLGPELAEGYVSSNPGEASVIVRLTPERWRTQDYQQRMG